MTLKQALSLARDSLAFHNIEDTALESELLLRHALKLSRVELYLELENELEPEAEKAFRELLRRRTSGEPTAYIINHREFYGLDFYVDKRVLIPRPESELLVEKALEFARSRPANTIADIGTGCGAIAISLALNLPEATIYASDISPDALEVAGINCAKHGVSDQVNRLCGNLLEPVPGPVDLIVANLPYVRQTELKQVNTTNFEPDLALNGGRKGLDRIESLCRQAKGKLCRGGGLLLEIGYGQKETVTTLLNGRFPAATIEVTPDLSGIDRVVSLLTA